ncbi:MAG: hypothetical protein V8T87_04755, partial [Victivallales bacterium]
LTLELIFYYVICHLLPPLTSIISFIFFHIKFDISTLAVEIFTLLDLSFMRIDEIIIFYHMRSLERSFKTAYRAEFVQLQAQPQPPLEKGGLHRYRRISLQSIACF